jgi:hypothetical protein
MTGVSGAQRRARSREPRRGRRSAYGRKARLSSRAIELERRRARERRSAGDLDPGIGERMGDSLELADRAAELLARARVLPCPRQVGAGGR